MHIISHSKYLSIRTVSYSSHRFIVPTKNGKERVITLAPAVMDKLANQKNWQESCKKAKVSRKYAEVH